MPAAVVTLQDLPPDPSLEPFSQECPEYHSTVRAAQLIDAGEGFGDVERLDVFRVSDIADNGGRVVFIFLPEHIPDEAGPELVERLTLYAFLQMHKRVVQQQREYSALWLCMNDPDRWSPLPLRWWRRTYWATPFVYHERLHALCVVHPSLHVRARLLMLSYLRNAVRACWEKLVYADRLEFLDEVVPIPLIKTLPQSVKEYDKDLDREMAAAIETQKDAGLNGLMGASAGMPPMSMPGLGPDGDATTGGGVGGADGGSATTTLPKRNWED